MNDAQEKQLEPGPAVPDQTSTTPNGQAHPLEFGGRSGLEPTRYGDWEKAGRCIDF